MDRFIISGHSTLTEWVIIQAFCFDDQYDNDKKPKEIDVNVGLASSATYNNYVSLLGLFIAYDNDNKPKEIDMSILVLLWAQPKITTSVHRDYS